MIGSVLVLTVVHGRSVGDFGNRCRVAVYLSETSFRMLENLAIEMNLTNSAAAEWIVNQHFGTDPPRQRKAYRRMRSESDRSKE